MIRFFPLLLLLLASGLGLPESGVLAQGVHGIWLPEERSIRVREPNEFTRARIPANAEPPPTVAEDIDSRPETKLELDDLIRQSLENTQVVRVLSGTGSASSGLTIFDPAISNSRIDQQQAIFDPTVAVRQDFLRTETPFSIPNRVDQSPTSVQVGQRTASGGNAVLQFDTDRIRRLPNASLLNPTSPSSVSLGYSQPLLRGAGVAVNRVPIVLARLDAESSYFRLKDGVQETVRGVIEGYWRLVAARTTVWAIEQQVEQANLFVALETARLRIGSGDQAQLAQAKLALANFRSNLIGAEAEVLNAEASLRGILGQPPNSPEQLLPMTPPVTEELAFDWDALLSLAEEHRPDIIELKIILEADYQLILQSRNQALPQLDAAALYRWNGLEGEIPNGNTIRTQPGQYTDWQMGVNFSVPLGLRQSRAALRERQLLLARDRVNLDQGLLEMVHDIAAALRRLSQLHASYRALRDTRLAATDNLTQQVTSARRGTVAFINVQQAIVDWGNAVSAEARALTQYNTELATLERLTGTILESHGVRFYEERYGSIGPLGLLGHERLYPRAIHPSSNEPRYPEGETPVDREFQKDRPELLMKSPDRELKKLPPDDSSEGSLPVPPDSSP